MSRSRFVVSVALLANLLVTATKFAAAAITGSAAMLSEAFHSTADTGNEGLLLYGQSRARVPPDEDHPLGYGRELYFWSFVVAVLIFAVGGCLSAYEGVGHVLHPKPIQNPLVSYIVFAAAFLFEAVSWALSIVNFNRARGTRPFWEAVRKTKDPPSIIVFFEDSAALLGILIAAGGTLLSVQLHEPWIDGAASLGIALVLVTIAVILARESKDLLIGEAAGAKTRRMIRETARKHPAVRRLGPLVTVHLSPEQIVAALTADFEPSLRTSDLEAAIAGLEAEIRRNDPRIIALYIKPQRVMTDAAA